MHISIEDRLKKVVGKALSDHSYMERLIEHKSDVLEEVGICTKNQIEIEFKSGISVPIFENGFLYIPLSEDWAEEKEDLSDDELLRVAGGFNYNLYAYIGIGDNPDL